MVLGTNGSIAVIFPIHVVRFCKHMVLQWTFRPMCRRRGCEMLRVPAGLNSLLRRSAWCQLFLV